MSTVHQGLSGRDAQLPLDQVEPGDLFGDRVLDLDAGIELEEEHLVAGDEELGRAGASIADRGREGDGAVGDPGADGLVEAGWRRFLDHLLVPALHRAVPQPDSHDLAV